MVVEYNVFCFDRTLRLIFPDSVTRTESQIIGYLEVLYDKWMDAKDTVIEAMPLEEFLVFGIGIFCGTTPTWESIDNEE